jgi:regulator of protease activity HflC (stomatin/prohibitin superfamily)
LFGSIPLFQTAASGSFRFAYFHSMLIVFGLFIVLLVSLMGGFVLAGPRVPEGTVAVIERLGKFHRVLLPGRHLILPVIDQVAYRIPLAAEGDTFKWDIATEEGHTFHITLYLKWAIHNTDPETITRVAYQFRDNQAKVEAIGVFVKRIVTDFFYNRSLVLTLHDQEAISQALKAQLGEHMKTMGYRLLALQLKDIYRD